jgi:sporulation protein YlmC with PRC-barrel domain
VPHLSDFRLGADVVDGDGLRVGILASVLVEQKGFDPRAIVVKTEASLAARMLADERLFINDEVTVPIAAVESATHDLVRLSMPAADVRRRPPYLSYRLAPQTTGGAWLEEAELLGGGLGLPGAQEIANKGKGEIEIDKDENVMLGTTGRRLGRVQDLLFDRSTLIGVVIRPEGFFKQDLVLPARFINRADDMALFANLDESDIAGLKPFVDGD